MVIREIHSIALVNVTLRTMHAGKLAKNALMQSLLEKMNNHPYSWLECLLIIKEPSRFLYTYSDQILNFT